MMMNLQNLHKIFAVLLFIACSERDATLHFSTGPSLPACKEFWQSQEFITKGQHFYDWQNDAQLTDDGNIGYQTYKNRLMRHKCLKEMTILVYMQADNNLSTYAFADLYEMEGNFAGRNLAASTVRNDLIVQLDTVNNSGIRRLHMQQVDEPYDRYLAEQPEFYQRTEKDIKSPIVEINKNEQQQTQSESLKDFLTWGIQNYPSKHYMLIIWGHGEGWTSKPPEPDEIKPVLLTKTDLPEPLTALKTNIQTPRKYSGRFYGQGFGGIAVDDSQKDYIDIPTLKNILKEISTTALQGKPLDIYASDACLMQMLEVATELSDVATYIIGSAETQNFYGFPYRTMMRKLNTGHLWLDEEKDFINVEQFKNYPLPKQLAITLPKIQWQTLNIGGLQATLAPEAIDKMTMSSIYSSSLVGTLIPALKNFSEKMITYLHEDDRRKFDVRFLMSEVADYLGDAREFSIFMEYLLILLSKEQNQTASIRQLRQSINEIKNILLSNNTVVSYALGKNYHEEIIKRYLVRGVSVWLPSSKEAYRSRIANAQNSEFYKMIPQWHDWLQLVFSGASEK